MKIAYVYNLEIILVARKTASGDSNNGDAPLIWKERTVWQFPGSCSYQC